MNPYLTPSGRGLLLATAAFLAVGALAASWLLILIGVLLAATLLLAFYGMLPATLALERRLLSVEVTPHPDAPPLPPLTGRPVQLQIAVHNRSGATLRGVRLIPHMASGLRLLHDPQANLHLPAFSALDADMTLTGFESGRWALHGFEVRLRDALGLFEVGEYVASPTLLKLLPDVVVSRAHSASPNLKALAQQRAGLHAVIRKGFGLELRELRQHQHGDPFRSIAWKATARTGRLMVKEHESELVLSAYVCLDISSTMRGGVPPVPSRLEHGLRLAFAFAEMTVRNNDCIGLATFDEKLYGHLRSRTGRPHLAQLLHHLVGLRHIVDEDLSEFNDAEVTDALVRYLLIQERLDFRRQSPLKPVKGVGQGMDYWSFSRRVADHDDALYELELLEQWLRAVLPDEARRFDDPALHAGVLDDDRLSLARRFCLLRGVEIPYRVETRLGQKERGLAQTLEATLTHARDAHLFLIVTDLCGIMNLEPVLKLLRHGLSRRHRFAFLVPFTPDYLPRPELPGTPQLLHDIFRRAELDERATHIRALEKLGIPAISVQPGDSLPTLLPRLTRYIR